MDFLLDALTNWLKEMLVGGIMGNLSGMFDSVNQQVADIATQVGQTPQGWNGSIFSMIQNLSNSIMKRHIPSLRAQRFYLAVLRWSEKQEVQSTSPVHFLSKAAKQQFFFAQGQMIRLFFSQRAVSTMAQ